jgi:flagellar protein FlgJ
MNLPSLNVPPAGILTGETGLADLRRIAEESTGATDPAARNEALRKVGEQFEAVFIRLLMKQMRRTIPQSDLFGGSGNEREIYEEIGDAALAGGIGRQGSLGIADMLVAQLGEEAADIPSTEQFLARRGAENKGEQST